MIGTVGDDGCQIVVSGKRDGKCFMEVDVYLYIQACGLLLRSLLARHEVNFG